MWYLGRRVALISGGITKRYASDKVVIVNNIYIDTKVKEKLLVKLREITRLANG